MDETHFENCWVFHWRCFAKRLDDLCTQSDEFVYSHFGMDIPRRYLLISENLIPMFAQLAWDYSNHKGFELLPNEMLKPEYWKGTTYRGITVLVTYNGAYESNILRVVYDSLRGVKNGS